MSDCKYTKIEDNINDVLVGERQKLALDFVDFLRTNDMPIELNIFWHQGSKGHFWFANYKETEAVCFILIDGDPNIPNSWEIFTGENEKSAPECTTDDEKLKEMAWQHINFCGKDCGGSCKPGKSRIILGKNFDNVCGSAMNFPNPDGETLNYAKKLITLTINTIDKA
ncbi:MAG: hypothetical protein FWE06_05220 [Oscillospiraceae bacterium]|nr:hypothetical protein [Oscillospiraceae bacterium]